MSVQNIPTDASSASTLNGTSWLSNLLRDGLGAYVAVQTVKNQNRDNGAVVTQDPVRVGPPAASAAVKPVVWIVGAVVVGLALLFALFRRRSK